MKQVFKAIAGILAGAAKVRAELVMRAQAEARSRHAENYASNAGGWN